MVNLWLQDTDRQWAVLPLTGDRLPLDATLPGLARGADAEFGRAELVRSAEPDREWVLLAQGEDNLRVNGLPLPLGIRVLRHRDEIRLGSLGTAFFSTETLARVVEYPGPTAVECARCRVEIQKGFLAVQCPNCDVWFHEGPDEAGKDRPCFTYAPTCVYCPHGTRLDAGYQWSPEDL